ncbi:MAG: outer membrane beta-barrel protein [Zoogloeaceae bacterium]|nr:outer membrane beta-barrel protein [Zoogloeaceae bacterium]
MTNVKPRCIPHPWRHLAPIIGLGLLAVAAKAADEPLGLPQEGFRVHLTESARWENNLFRLPDDTDPEDGSPRSDRWNQATIALAFDHAYSLQHLSARLGVTDRRHANHSNLDSTTADGHLRWDWALGSDWNGRLGVFQREAPRNFADTSRRILSINTLRQAEAEATYRLQPAWRTRLGITTRTSRYSDSQSRGSEYDEAAVETGLDFLPRTGNRIGLTLRQAEGRYLERRAGADTGYHQTDLRLTGEWRLTGKTVTTGAFGVTRREGGGRPEFNGPAGRIVVDWQPTGKLGLRTTLRREIGSEDEVLDNDVVSRALTLEPRWIMTAKLTLQGMAEWLRRDGGSAGDSGNADQRTRSFGLGLLYQPRPTISVAASYQHATRSAADNRLDYTAQTVGLDLKMQF